MSLDNLVVDLESREDKNQRLFFIGRLKFPGTIDCSKGLAILIFTADDDEEELQIAELNQDNATYNEYTKKSDRLSLSLEPRVDQFNKTYYISKIKFNGYIDCSSSATFLVFTSQQGNEELQIVGKIVKNNKPKVLKSYAGKLRTVEIE